MTPGTAVKVEINGQEVAVYNVDGKFFATSNICPHQAGRWPRGCWKGATSCALARLGSTCPDSPVNPRAKIPCFPVKVRQRSIGRYRASMAYVIAEPCYTTKYQACVPACPWIASTRAEDAASTRKSASTAARASSPR